MHIYSVYKATNILNQKCYIGITKNFTVRKSNHKALSKYSCYKFHKAIRKHGWSQFHWEVIYQSKDLTHIRSMEIYFIELFNSFKMGYNSTLGGDNAVPMTQDIRNKISTANLGKRRTAEVKLKLSQAHSGPLNGMYGKSHSLEARHKISQARINADVTADFRNKMRAIKQSQPRIMCNCGREFTIQNVKRHQLKCDYFPASSSKMRIMIAETSAPMILANSTSASL